MIDKLSVLLLCTLPDAGIKSLGSKALIPINKKPILQHQIEIITKTLKNIEHEIVVLCSFDCNRISKFISNYLSNHKLTIVKHSNPNMNFGGALLDGLKYAQYHNILSINYGCIFNKMCLLDFIRNDNNNVGVIKSKHTTNINLGCYINNNSLENIFFDLNDTKYGDIIFLNEQAKQTMLKFDKDFMTNKFTFEIVNLAINNNIKFNPVFMNDKNYIFINNLKSLNRCKRIINESYSKTKR